MSRDAISFEEENKDWGGGDSEDEGGRVHGIR